MNETAMLYGEVIFSTFKVKNGSFEDFEFIFKRFIRSAKEYFMLNSINNLEKSILAKINSFDLSNDCRLRVNIFPKNREQVFVSKYDESDLEFSFICLKLPTHIRKELKLKTFEYNTNSMMESFKTSNYAQSFYLKRCAIKDGFDDICYTSNEKILESSTSNFIFRKNDGSFVTPKLKIYFGSSIKKMLDKQKIKEGDIDIRDLSSYTDCYLINSIEGLVSVFMIENFVFKNEHIESIL
ncbi:MAG: aminotransferase class IV [Bacteriovoracaceae bacterium]|jgi:branched-subunit amino acid aminotransferase/4-amino-4-deoxychorismate lyase|nr:aminotransferase class IV [Bacteriovoracaceae bacterium]